jgi:hypothetical protein
MRFNQDPYQFLGAGFGPPTRPTPERAGQGDTRFVFHSSPVTHTVTGDGGQFQAIQVHPEEAHKPVEHALLRYMRDAGENPATFHLPLSEMHWDARSEQFGFPDSRPATTSRASSLPHDDLGAASGDLNPVTGRWPSSRGTSRRNTQQGGGGGGSFFNRVGNAASGQQGGGGGGGFFAAIGNLWKGK